MGQVTRYENVTSWEADGAITKDAIVVSNAAGKVLTGAGANDANAQGVAVYSVADGEAAAVAGLGDIVWVTAGAAIAHGDALIIGDSSGRAIPCPFAATTVYNIVGYARGACSNADEKVTMIVQPHLHYNHA